MTEPAPGPRLTVLRGDPSPEQLAALVVVLVTRSGAAAPEPVAPSRWRSPLRAPLPPPGPGAWRGSGLRLS